jgi:hypothetical protein
MLYPLTFKEKVKLGVTGIVYNKTTVKVNERYWIKRLF